MSNRLLPAASVLVVAACSTAGRKDAGDSQKSYTYPGCVNQTGYCPNDKTYFCALDAIRDRHNSCADAGDCTIGSISGDCNGYVGCEPTVVNVREAGAFYMEALAETKRFCADAHCLQSGSGCSEALSYSAGRVACVQGTCVALTDDGGPP